MAEIEALNDDVRSIVESLCARAGILMEDLSVVALLVPSSDEELISKVRQARSAVEKMRLILDAADALLG